MSETTKKIKNNKEKGGLDTPKAIVIAACVLSIGVGLGLAFSGGNGSGSGAYGNSGGSVAGAYDAPTPTTAEDVIAQFIDLAENEHNINGNDLQACIEDGEVESFIQSELEFARDVREIRGTPNSVIVSPDGEQAISVPGFVRDSRVLQEIVNMMVEEGSFIVPEGVESSFPEVDSVEIRADDFVYGNPDAPVKFIEFSDLSCGFCAAFHPVVHELVDNNPDKVAWVYRHLPYQNLGFEKAVIAQCVGELSDNDTFWNYMDDAFQL